MSKDNEQADKKADAVKKHRLGRNAIIAGIVTVAFAAILALGTLAYNNISLAGDETFAKRIDAAIEKGLAWTESNKQTILKRRNVGLIKMLNEIENLRATPVFSDIITSFMATPVRPKCWKRLVDPNWPVDKIELNIAIKKEYLDNKWVLYAIAPDKAQIRPEEVHLFDPQRWRGRKLTHQLDALITLRKAKGANEELDKLIEHLSSRITSELIFDVAVVDLYIQKVTFLLRAGLPHKIRRRWIERIIENQSPDGGWNDRWFCLTSKRRPVFEFGSPPSNQHATIQALTALYLARYRYPEHFGLQ